MADEDWVEDSLQIERVEPGALWFEGGVTVVLVRVRGVWYLVEVGNVYP